MHDKSATSSSGSIGSVLLVTVFVATLFSGLTAYIVTQWFDSPTGDVPFVVLDSGRLVEASIRAIREQELGAEDVVTSAANFSDALNRSTTRFVDAGFVVINRGAVLDFDPRLDITELVAHELGLDLD